MFLGTAGIIALTLAASSCAPGAGDVAPEAARPEPTPAPHSSPTERPGRRPPPWLGTRVLPRGPDGYGVVRPTPRVLRNRQFASLEVLPPPDSARFEARIAPVPRRVLRRSTWSPRCPVDRSRLRYVQMVFWGFDRRPHTGEMIVHRSAARGVAAVFRTLFRHRFPIEEMRVVAASELDAPPTGDGNNTTAFVCRPARGSSSWSQHAYGLAVDVNPFHNPYVSDDVVLPELASAYTKRGWRRPGMVVPGGVVVRAFDRVGWSWGGNWSSVKDWMHFSATGG